MGKIFGLLKDTFKEWNEDKAPRLGAALAYYTIFSIGPLLLIATAVAGLLFQNAQVQIIETIQGVVGKQGAEAIKGVMENSSKGSGNIIATVIGIVTLLLGASGVFGQLKDALNTIWEVQLKPGGIMQTIKRNFLSLTMVLGTGFLLLVSLVVSAGIAGLGKFLSSTLPGSDLLWQIVNFFISILVIAVMFALLFKFLPDVKIGWKDVIIGALVTSVLFTLGQFALGLYLGKGSVGTAYGAAGSLVIILVWIYYSAQILFFGAEFTQVYTNKYGSRVRPAEGAEMLTDEAKAQQGIPEKDGDKDTKKGRAGRDRGKGSLKVSPWFR